MNTEKAGSYTKLLVTFLVAVILVFTFGLVADGWQEENTNPEESPSDDSDSTGGAAEDDSTETGAIPIAPKYYNRITGLECTEQDSKRRHISYTVHSNLPFYGVSDADMMIEFPTEGGETRLLVFTGDFSKYGKIGTLSATRSYISVISSSFDAILTSLGKDGETQSTITPSDEIDLTKQNNSYYTEYTHYAYTNATLLNSAIGELGINTVADSLLTLPYLLTDKTEEITQRNTSAARVYIPYSLSHDTTFTYSQLTGKYTYEKGAIAKKDNLTGEFVTFDNLFLLFADAVTYEDKSGEMLSLDTTGGGEGYYIHSGYATKILWTSSAGSLRFTDEHGQDITASVGKTYIGYVKSSKTQEVNFS